MTNNAADFVRAETAKATIFTPTDARNNYELTKLIVRAELPFVSGPSIPLTSVTPASALHRGAGGPFSLDDEVPAPS